MYAADLGGGEDEACYDEIEISVILIDYEFGHKSYGWDGVDKLIILDGQISSPEEYAFALKAAEILCRGLNE